MFLAILKLFFISLLISYLFKWILYDILCIPINYIYAIRQKSDPYNQLGSTRAISMVGGLILLIIFTYLFTGLSSSFLSYGISINSDSFLFQSFTIALALGTPFALKDRAGDILRQDVNSIDIPSVFACPWLPYTTSCTSLILLLEPAMMKYWWWMPYVN